MSHLGHRRWRPKIALTHEVLWSLKSLNKKIKKVKKKVHLTVAVVVFDIILPSLLTSMKF